MLSKDPWSNRRLRDSFHFVKKVARANPSPPTNTVASSTAPPPASQEYAMVLNSR